jgi:DNA polymerase-3 subunit delta'
MSFQDIAGNGHIKKILRLALQRRRVPNSLLFNGPEGVGKRETALVLAKALNCLQKTDDSCDVCDNCRAIDSRKFPDIIEISPERDVIKVEQMTVIKQMAYLKPMIGRKRVFIVDPADKMNEESANSVLKVLEEPPLFSHIILLSDNQAFILPTIKSRCQTLNFLPVSTEEIQQALRERGFEEEKARIMALLVRGNMERALALDWDDIQQRRQEAWSLFLGLIGQEGSSRFLKKFAFQRRNQVKEDLEQTLEFFSSFCRDLVMMQENGDPGLLFNPDFEPRIRDSVAALRLDEALRWLGLIDQALANLDRNLNMSLLVSSFYSQVLG